ncbi:MAG: hypothetical protein FWB90_01120 [Fibromonadales bacterium]|nr:hypothetical protein [Fibromonadales bacterium]
MKKNAFLPTILPIFCVFALSSGYAQGLPVVLGAVLETGSGLLEMDNYGNGIVRITPFAGVWINGIGFARVGISTSNKKEIPQNGYSDETKRLDFSTQIGFSAIGPERPYIAASYVRNKAYSSSSDFAWNEWGLGIGHRFMLSPYAAIVVEAEHRWITEHYDGNSGLDISGRRLQMNFGLVAQPF